MMAILLIDTACSNKPEMVTITQGKSIRFNLDEIQSLPPVHPRIRHINGTDVITYIDFANRDIVFQQFNSPDHHRIDISLFDYQYVQNYEIVSPDSILLAFNTTYFGGNHNMCVLLIDSNGQIIDSARVDQEYIQKVKDKRHWDSLYYADFTYFPLIYDRKNECTFLGVSPYLELCQDGLINKPYTPFIKSYLHAQNKMSVDVRINPICSESPSFYHADAKYTRACYTGSEIIFGFGHTSDIYRYSLNSEKISRKEINTSFSQYHNFGKDHYEEDAFDYGMADWSRIYYDPYKNLILRLLRLPIPEDSSPLEKNYPKYVLFTLDMNLKVINEGVLPFGLSQQLLIGENGYWAYNAMESERTSAIVFTQIVFTEGTTKKVDNLTKSKNDDIVGYLSEIGINGANKTVVFIPLDNSCGACLEKFAAYIQEHPQTLKNQNLELVIFSSSHQKAQEYINIFKDADQHLTNVVIDDRSIHKTYLQPWVNPRLVGFDKHTNVIEDKIYDPDEMRILMNRLGSSRN